MGVAHHQGRGIVGSAGSGLRQQLDRGTNHRGQQAAEVARQLIADRASPRDNQPPVADSANGARHYLAAAELLVLDETLKPVAPVIGYAAWPEFGDRITNEQRKILEDMVASNQAAFDLCRHARSFELFDYVFRDPLDTTYNTMILAKLRRLSRWINIKTHLATAENDLEETAACLVDAFALSRSMNGGENVLVELVGISVSALAHGLTEETLSRVELDSDALGRVRDAAKSSLNPEGIANAIESEARAIAELIDTPDIMASQIRFDEAETAAVVDKMMKQGLLFEVEDEPWWSGVAWRLREAHFVLSPGLLQIQGLAQVKYHFAAADRIRSGELLDEAFIEDAVRNGVDYAPGNATAQRTKQKNQAALLTLIHAIEAERFRIQNGRWPIDMKELMDGESIPVDPWGTALSLLHNDDGIRVYSWGPNRRDDGGALHWKDENAPEDTDDEHTRLLNPGQRGLIPKPISTSQPTWGYEDPYEGHANP